MSKLDDKDLVEIAGGTDHSIVPEGDPPPPGGGDPVVKPPVGGGGGGGDNNPLDQPSNDGSDSGVGQG